MKFPSFQKNSKNRRKIEFFREKGRREFSRFDRDFARKSYIRVFVFARKRANSQKQQFHTTAVYWRVMHNFLNNI